VDRGTYSDTYAYGYGECGYLVQVEGERSGRYVVRQDRDASAPLLGDVYEYREVHTRADTGERFVVRGHGITRDVAVTGLGDGLVRVRSLEAGQPFDMGADVEWFGSCSARVQHDLGHPEGTSPCTTPDEVRGFLEYALGAYDVDPDRVFLTGLSCGGVGVWEYLAQGEGPAVRGAVPIATDGRPSWDAAGCDLAGTATWVFHGDADDVMDPRGATETATHLQGCPTPPAQESRLTVYPGVDHDSWSRTYDRTAGNDVFAWMLALP